MYLPFLRGKQFELIALRELEEVLTANRDKISPIIEPVKETAGTIRKTLELLKENNINFSIILNPIVGDLKNKHDRSSQILDFLNEVLSDYSNFQFGFYIQNEGSITELLRIREAITIDNNGYSLVHLSPINSSELFEQIQQDITYNLIDFNKTTKRYHRNFPQETKVTLDDNFRILTKNSDYILVPDEPFTEEHLYYRDDGYIGFSDYLTIGESYSESGFLPYAVVIHLTYADSHNKIRIRHFVSDSNEDYNDVAGKFAEALEKTIRWVNDNEIQETKAITELKDFYESGHFPGLGIIKKLSVMNHIELILRLI